MTASPGDGEHAAREGYYPDPSIPGYIRYWNGAAWVPGTSRPAPVQETGPVFLDETSVTEALPEPEPVRVREPEREPEPAVWQADPLHQAGFGGPRDHRVSWGSPAEPEPEPGQAAARPAGISLARTPAAAAAPARPPAASMGILSARSPAAQAPAPAPAPAPAVPAPAPAWPDAPGAGVSGATSSWPGAAAAAAPAPAPAPSRPAAPADPGPEAGLPAAPRPGTAQPAEAPRHEVWAPRPAGVRPKVPTPEPAAPAEPRAKGWEPRGSESDRPSRPAGGGTPRAVFERMADRAVRPAGLTRRFVARALDSLVLTAVAAAVARPLLPEATAHVQAKVDAARASGRTTTVWLFDTTIAGHLGLVLGAVFLFGVLYEALPTACWGRTPGKKLLGVRVLATATLRPPTFGAALRRWLVYALLGLPGSLWCLVDRPRRQTWHDKAAGTYVAR
ncbi:RDD family protein [Streptomyces sp. NPDC058412]|uniref:RDD family protein n=1 Tax=unclassified Streptomyces TaxID=2593676 RepID=UPI00364FE8B9